MKDRSNFYQYQKEAIQYAKDRKHAGLFLDMGLGKTVISLTVATDLLSDFYVTTVLIVAPLRVCNTVWKQQAEEWEHLKHLKINICTGTPKNRLKNLQESADIHIINRENIPWLCEQFKNDWRWDMLIVDESSSFKSHSSKRFKSLRKVIKHFNSTLILSGTPSPNGLMDLWAQICLLDNGQRLGRNITAFRKRYFNYFPHNYAYELIENSEDRILWLIDDICITMKAEDHIELPNRIDIVRKISLPAKVDAQYKEFEKEFILALESDSDIIADSAGVLAGKLLQVCNGAIYDKDKNVTILHDEKLSCLKDIMEEHPDDNFLIAYNFKTDRDRIVQAFPESIVLSRGGEELIEWNKGNIKMLLTHPASAGHGLNAQFGGSIIIWFGLTWSLELYQQFNARLHRQGQTKCVRVVHIVADGKIDGDVMRALNSKAKTQQEVIDYLKHNY